MNGIMANHTHTATDSTHKQFHIFSLKRKTEQLNCLSEVDRSRVMRGNQFTGRMLRDMEHEGGQEYWSCYRAHLRLSYILVLAWLIARTVSVDAQPLTLTHKEAVRIALAVNQELRTVEFNEAVERFRILISFGYYGEDYPYLFAGRHGASLEPALSILAEWDLGIFGQRRRHTEDSEARPLRLQIEIFDAHRRISMQSGERYFT